jgi:hypothetical protein
MGVEVESGNPFEGVQAKGLEIRFAPGVIVRESRVEGNAGEAETRRLPAHPAPERLSELGAVARARR